MLDLLHFLCIGFIRVACGYHCAPRATSVQLYRYGCKHFSNISGQLRDYQEEEEGGEHVDY